MKHVKLFEEFSTQSLTEDQKIWLDKCARGSWNLNPSTGLVDVDVDFYCAGQGLKDFKGVAFGHVDGGFDCSINQLTSLEGAPKTVDVGFACDNNQLTSLEGAPKTVDGRFYCGSNPISERTLESIFSLMKNGKSYQQALEESWPEMDNDDRLLMYKDHRSLTPKEIRRYDALTTVNRIKNYL